MNSDDEENVNQDLVSAVKTLHGRCQHILRECAARQENESLEGLYRLTQPLIAESVFLEKLLSHPSTIKQKYIQSTNLSYLEAVYDAMALVGPIDEVMRAAAVPPKNGQWMALTTMLRQHSLKLDLVAEHERVWIKVIARNTKAFRHEIAGLEWDDDDSDDSDGDDDNHFGYNDNFSDDDDDDGGVDTPSCSFDDLPIFKKAKAYLACAQAHPVHFKVPVVVFAFMRIGYNQDPYVQRIMDRLEEMGICVYLQNQDTSIRTWYLPAVERVFGSSSSSSSSSSSNINHTITTSTLNLDVSTVLAMVSELSHHPCGVDDIEGEALKMQAEQQATQPILPVLQQILQGKQLVMVQSAFDRLQSIMDVVAGPTEKQRYHYLFPNTQQQQQQQQPVIAPSTLWTILTPPPPTVTIVPDQPSTRFMQLLEPPSPSKQSKQVTATSKLNNGKKIRSRFSSFHAGIFGTADHLQLTTISAIQWMPSALAEAGLLGSSIITHPPRSLAEQKMHTKTVSD